MNNIEEDSLLDSLVEPGYFGKTADNIKVFKNFVEPDDLAAIGVSCQQSTSGWILVRTFFPKMGHVYIVLHIGRTDNLTPH